MDYRHPRGRLQSQHFDWKCLKNAVSNSAMLLWDLVLND